MAHSVLLLLGEADGIVLVEMPRLATIIYKDPKSAKSEIQATFQDEVWERLKTELEAYANCPSEAKVGGFYKAVVQDKGDEPIDLYLSFVHIRAIS